MKKPLLTIVGPTASGKTHLALALAQTHPIEIISLDSALVDQGLDIGTAKPSQQERAQVPHHLIDIITPLAVYSAATFVADTQKLVGEIQNRGNIPVLVGGTMMYFKALSEGLNNLPAANESVRSQLQTQKTEQGLAFLYQQLCTVDPVTAARLKPTDSQRIERALEVYLLTGKPMSQHFEEQDRQSTDVRLWTLALIPQERSQLHQQIARRFEAMLAQGFIEEVRQLKTHYPELTEQHASIRCVGYRQAWQYLHNEMNHTQMQEQAIIATRQLAKRQLTWLRQTDIQHTIDPYATQGLATALTILQHYLDAP